ncbi:asparagine synthase-related protein [Streptomyces sp. NPDC049916]|uniref:asparagine synthase-related protein n=1 Tax=Streptomyces sp. NPDC049916 TaxID=3155156 RepID=UPI00341CB44B
MPGQSRDYFVVLPDSVAGAAAAGQLPPPPGPTVGGTRTVAHASGRPWVVARLLVREVSHVARGADALVLIGPDRVPDAVLAGLLEGARGRTALEHRLARLPGLYHVIARLSGETWIRGTATGLRRIYHARHPDAGTIASDRPAVLAHLIGAPLDDGALALRLLDFLPHPLSRRAMWRGVHETGAGLGLALPAAAPGTAAAPGPTEHRWWEPPPGELSLAEGALRLRDAVAASVRAHVGGLDRISCELSGGMDSTALTFTALNPTAPASTALNPTAPASTDPGSTAPGSTAPEAGPRVVSLLTVTARDRYGEDEMWARRAVQHARDGEPPRTGGGDRDGSGSGIGNAGTGEADAPRAADAPGEADAPRAARGAGVATALDHHLVPAADVPYFYADLAATADELNDEPLPVAPGRARAHLLLSRARATGSRYHLTGYGGDEIFLGLPHAYQDLFHGNPLTAWNRLSGLRHQLGWPLLPTVRALADRRSFPRWIAGAVTPDPQPVARTPLLSWGVRQSLHPWLTDHARAVITEEFRAAAAYAEPIDPWRGRHVDIDAVRMGARHFQAMEDVGLTIGLPVAAPFYDDRVLEATLAVRPAERLTPQRYKPLLAEAMRGVVPDALLARTTKDHMSSDEHQGLRRHAPELADLWTGSRLAEHGLVDARRLLRLAAEPYSPVLVEHSISATVAAETWLRTAENAWPTRTLDSSPTPAPSSGPPPTPSPTPTLHRTATRTSEASP